MSRGVPQARWWLPESRRSTVVLVVSTAAAMVVGDLPTGWDDLLARTLDNVVIMLILYFVLYSLLTTLVFVLADRDQVEDWAQSETRGTFLQRYLLGTAPGPGLSIFVGGAALLVTVFWLPGIFSDASTFSDTKRTMLSVALVVAAWITVAVSFAAAYLAEDVQTDWHALDFPGEESKEDRELTDYVYLAIAVSTTFGTTDVSFRSPEVRRTATVHAVIAFVFNTVVLAVVVSLLA